MQAKDLKPGWFFSIRGGSLMMCLWHRPEEVWCARMNNATPITEWILGDTEVTHHPDCTGWDWPIPQRVKLEVGKRYVMRCGITTDPMDRNPLEGSKYAFKASTNEPFRVIRTWMENGRHSENELSELDIVSEYVEPPAIDPGEGWRLLEDEEVVEDGDQCFRSHWFDCTDTTGEIVLIGKQEGFIKAFRRRIEPQPAIDCDCDCRPAEFGKMHVPFTQHTFRKHFKKMVYEKSMPDHWFRPQEIKPHAVLIGALWVEWDRLLTGFEFVGGGVCGEKHG